MPPAVDAAHSTERPHTRGWIYHLCNLLRRRLSASGAAEGSDATTGGISSCNIHSRLAHRWRLLSVIPSIHAEHVTYMRFFSTLRSTHVLHRTLAHIVTRTGSRMQQAAVSQSHSLNPGVTQLYNWQLRKTFCCRSNCSFNPNICLCGIF